MSGSSSSTTAASSLRSRVPRFDGTNHLIVSPGELIERLVAVIPRPHKNLIQRLLRHLGMRDHPPPLAPARTADHCFDDVA